MRQHLAILALGLVGGSAAADPKPKPIDGRAQLAQLEVYRDDAGMYYVSPKPGAFADGAEKWVFYGDGKVLYQQQIVGSSSDGKGYAWSVWSPRVRGGLLQAGFVLNEDKPYVECRLVDNKPTGRKPLVALTADEARTLLGRAKLYGPLWQRSAKFLARDDDGVYYYVDQLSEEAGGKGFRVFVGKKGALKEQAMTNVVSDSAGEIYATKTGDLKIVTEAGDKAHWKKGAARRELVVLELYPNRYLIYRELGIYGQLGVVCDDQ